MIATAAYSQSERIQVGAIRWDAWTGGSVTGQVERTLGPAKYRNRLPWFAEVLDEKSVKINGDRQTIMDREIEFASEAGLAYWAFLIYPETNSMSTALKQYLQSPKRKQLRFCVILHGTLRAKAELWPKELARLIRLLQEPGYQTVMEGRPLVYAFLDGAFPFDRFHEFLAAARKEGLNPYSVYMGWNPAADFKLVGEQGFDAVSAYAVCGSQARFVELTEAAKRDYWQNAAQSAAPYVPLVTTGWDKWPRVDNPVSWEVGHGYHTQGIFPSRATPPEIAAHLQDALSFTQEHPSICPAKTIILYAWNEYDEGGWLAPARGADGAPDCSRLDAVRSVLKESSDTRPAWNR